MKVLGEPYNHVECEPAATSRSSTLLLKIFSDFEIGLVYNGILYNAFDLQSCKVNKSQTVNVSD